jgi:hypothetical protein
MRGKEQGKMATCASWLPGIAEGAEVGSGQFDVACLPVHVGVL